MLVRVILFVFGVFGALNAGVSKEKYYLSICAIFNEEGPYFREWIEYHQMLGVEHFYLYNHNSTDEYLQELLPYILSGVVELKDWNFTSVNWNEWKAIQVASYNDCIKNKKYESKWIAFIDIDEFIFPVNEFTIPEFLEHYDNYSGVVLNWQLYGTSNIWKIPENKLMIELLVQKAQVDLDENHQYKTILKPAHALEAKSGHYFKFKPGYQAVNTDFTPLEKIKVSDFQITTILVDKMRLNHYWTKDLYFFNHVKLPRQTKIGKGSPERAKRRAAKLNSVADFCMEKYVHPLRVRMFGEQ